MEKLKQITPDITKNNIEKIEKLFPNVITETKDDDGNIIKAINFEKLKQELSKELVNNEESYDFTWVGKKQAVIDANTPITKTLRPCKQDSVNWDKTENVYIEGDNLEVLKLLQETYLNKIKMIYIDPPYNRGKDLVYRDTYSIDKEEYEEELKLRDEEGNKQFKENTDSNPRFHSDWCSMMYSRLKIARNLLSDDGLIFISIDDNEVDNLKKMCDEIFGEDNFIEIFSWVKTSTPANLSKMTKKSCEYILLYKKNVSVVLKGLCKNSKSSNGLMNQTNKIGILVFPKNIVKTNLSNGIYKAGTYGTKSYTINLLENTKVVDGFFVEPIKLQGKFKWNQEYLNQCIQNGTKLYIQTKAFSPSYEKDEYAPEKPWNIINSSFGVGTNENASDELDNLFFKNFSNNIYPKPTSLIKYLMNFHIKKDSNSIILDFFSGSATTAHAVMQLNAEDGGNRKFIMVQLPEKCDEKSEAYKAGYKNICEIGKERIRRAGKKIIEETGKTDLDIGFRVFKVDESNMKDVYFSPDKYNQDMLEQIESNIKEDRNSEDLLFSCMLEWGLELSLPHKIEKIENNEVHIVNENELIACFDENISEDVVKQIAELKPLRVVFRDNSFSEDSDRINVEEIFKSKSPNTKIKIL